MGHRGERSHWHPRESQEIYQCDPIRTESRGWKMLEMRQVFKFKDIFWHAKTCTIWRRGGLTKCKQICTLQRILWWWGGGYIVRDKKEGGLLKPILGIIHLIDNEDLTKRKSQWGWRLRDGFEKYLEVQSMDGIVAFVCSAEVPSRKVAYCRTDSSLAAAAS